MTPIQIALFILAYALGAIPFGVLVARRHGVDIMSVGSKNVGATNVWRTLGKGPGTLVFLLDVAKGWVPSFVALQATGQQDLAFFVGIVAILGHSFSPFIRFKGGKGIATGLGVFLGTSPYVALIALAIFIALVAATRYVSLGSIIASLSLPILGWIFKDPWPMIVGEAVIGVFAAVRHKANIARLLNGTESKFELLRKNASAVRRGAVVDEPETKRESECSDPETDCKAKRIEPPTHHGTPF